MAPLNAGILILLSAVFSVLTVKSKVPTGADANSPSFSDRDTPINDLASPVSEPIFQGVNFTQIASKRWYGVQEADESTDKTQVNTVWPWPVKCQGPPPVQPIRYCYKDQRSADNLEDIVNHAIARWGPAMQGHVSALSIDLDEGAGGKIDVFCSDPRISDDALVISDETIEDNPAWNWEQCDTHSSTGYDYTSSVRGRHTLEFCHLKPDAKEGSRPFAIRKLTSNGSKLPRGFQSIERSREAKCLRRLLTLRNLNEGAMMHELGHVMGLAHEVSKGFDRSIVYALI